MCMRGWASEQPFLLEGMALKEGTGCGGGESGFDIFSGKILQTSVTDHMGGCQLNVTPRV